MARALIGRTSRRSRFVVAVVAATLFSGALLVGATRAPATTSTVSGTVTAGGTAVPFPNVQVQTASGDYVTYASSDVSGGFSVHLEDGTYRLVATGVPGTPYGSASATITVAGAAVHQDLSLPAANVTGHVLAPDGGALALSGTENVFVQVEDATGNYIQDGPAGASAANDGAYALTLPPGTYTLVAGPDNVASATPGKAVVTVSASGSVSQDIQLTRPQLTGTVVDGSGAPVENASVEVHSADGNDHASTPTGSDGSFAVGGLTPGGSDYTLEVFPPDGRPQLLHTTIAHVAIPGSGGAATAVSNNADGKIHFAVADATIHVSVLLNGSPVTSGANVYAYQSGGGYVHAESPTGSTYDLPVSDGTWSVAVQPASSSAGWIFAAGSISVTVDTSGGTHDFSARLDVTSASSHVTGDVVDASGAPLGADAAWVSVSSADGVGNGSSVGAGGSFDVLVPAGTYQVYVYPSDSSLGGPAPQTVTVADGATATVPTLTLIARDATIGGRLAYSNGTPIAGADVYGYQPDGGGYADATTGADGSYTMRVSAGSWNLGVSPQPTDPWVYQGEPLSVDVASGASSGGNDFTALAVVGHVAGTVTDPSGSLADVDAWVSASNADGEVGASVANGSFSIGAAAGTYTVQLYLSPGAPYLSTTTRQVTVGADGTVTPSSLGFPLDSLDDTISGRLVDATGAPVSPSGGVVVSASDDNGNYEEATVAADGTYSVDVGRGTWHLAVDVSDPGLAATAFGDGGGGIVSSTVVFGGSGATQTRDVIVAAADQDVQGTVRSSTGAAVPFAWIYVDSPPSATTPVHIGGWADETGHFDIQVPAGTYLVGASADLPGEGAPRVVTLDAASGTQSVSPLTLTFRQEAVTITGRVTAPAGVTASIAAWSDSGGYAETTTDSGGDYTLQVAGDDVWHIDASALVGDQAYTTGGGTAVAAGASGAIAADELTLTAQTVSPAQTSTFDASQPTVLHFGDVQLSIPGGTIDRSGQVSVTASPIPSPPDTAAAHPVGLGFSFQAFDSTGTQVKSRFPNSIRVTFPYDPDQLAALGLTPSQLAPAYLDPATNTYHLADAVVVDSSADTVSFNTDHFTDFVVETSSFAAPTVAGASPASWTAGAAQTITVTGTGFVSGAGVLVGTYAATGVSVVGPTTLHATVPAGVPAGTYAITVTNSSGRSGARAAALTLTGASSGGSSGGSSSSSSGSSGSAVTAQLAASMASFPASVRVGDQLTYVLSVSGKNAGLATGIRATLTLPDGVTLVSTSADHGPGTCTGTSTLSCFLDFISGTGTATVRVVVRVDKEGALPNTATITYDQLGSAAPLTASASADAAAAVTPPAAVVTSGGKVGASSIRVRRSGAAGVVATKVRLTRAATVHVSVLAGTPRKAVPLLGGSRLGRARAKAGATGLSVRSGRGSLAVRLLVDPRRLTGKAWLRVVVSGQGGAKTRLIPLRR